MVAHNWSGLSRGVFMSDVAVQVIELDQDEGRGQTVVVMGEVRKSYGSRVVLDGVNISVRSGEKVALIGPSGSGKTTILRLVMGLDKPDHGTIEICGDYL